MDDNNSTTGPTPEVHTDADGEHDAMWAGTIDASEDDAVSYACARCGATPESGA